MNSFRIKLKNIYDKYLIFIIIFFAFLTMLNYVFKDLSQMSVSYGGIIYRSIVIGLIAIIFCFGLYTYRKLPNKYILVCLFAYLLSNVLAIFIAPSIYEIRPKPITYILGIGIVLSDILSLLTSYFLLKEYIPHKKHIDIVCILMIFFGVFLAVYTYIFEYQDIINIFTKEHGWNYDVTSIFYESKTMYGFMLFVCSIFSIIYLINHHKYWMIIFPLFFMINALISRNKTSLVCIFLLIACYLVYVGRLTFKTHKRLWIIFLSLFGAILVTLCLFIFIPSLRIGIFSNIYDILIKDGIVVLQDRLNEIGLIITKMNNPFVVICGCGEKTASLILKEGNKIWLGDCIYSSNYGYGGLIKFSLYIALIVYIFKTLLTKDKTKLNKYIIIFILSIILFAGLFEDDSLVGLSCIPLFLTIPVYLLDKSICIK